MKKKIILALTGKMASGKTTACDYFITKHNAQRLKYSTPLRDILDRLFLEHNRHNMQELSRIIRETFGQDILAKIIARDAEELDAELVIIEGVRRPADVAYLKEIEGYHLVALEAPDKLRYERLTSRNENPDDQGKTWKEFQEQELADAERLIPEIMAQAEFTVDNTGSRDEFNEEIEAIYQKIKNES